MKQQVELPARANLDYAEQLFAQYLQDARKVPETWAKYFRALENHAPDGSGPDRKTNGEASSDEVADDSSLEAALLRQQRVDRFIRAFRSRGHIQALVDPLSDVVRYVPELDLQHYGLTTADLDRTFVCETLRGAGRLTLRALMARLREIYCGPIGVQYMHIDDPTMRHWVQDRVEDRSYWAPLPRDQQLRVLTRLTDAVVLEQFIRRKFVGAKSFSLEGAESLIPLLDLAIEQAAGHGVEEIVIGMAHRGRLNVLANIIGKNPREIFREFEDKDPDLYIGGGDVKYHLGYSKDYETSTGRRVHLSLCFNPSHLEFVNPVVLGRVRAKQNRRQDVDQSRVMSLMIHGDAAFIAEGVVQETLNLSRLPGYRAGGTVHVLVNNQIGFTTSPSEGRSAMYATSVAKMLPAPILHVNGEHPEAVARCIQLAMDFRQTFKQDVVIDMYCYRRLGHNEGDEPSFTQPLLYQRINRRKTVRDGYLEHLLKLEGVRRAEADEIAEARKQLLEHELQQARDDSSGMPPSSLAGVWQGYLGGPEPKTDPDTGVPANELSAVLEKLTEVPGHFSLHPKLAPLLALRRQMAQGEKALDWAAGEALALATLATGGYPVRLSGQDSARGTFSHRHAEWHDVETGLRHIPLQHLAPGQAPVSIYNSPLSEAGVLGFEYGYSLDTPEGLVIWEAQFGDFINAAQVIVDQFLASGEDKWRRLSGLVLLLPHAFEGAGPEHSSARLERFLSLAAEDNLQVVVPTTPAQFFHVLRRQAVRRWRKPLVIFTPKSMLRHPRAVSSLADCAQGKFQKVFPDPQAIPSEATRRVLLCSGKLFYELQARCAELEARDVAIVRLEQLYPFPWSELEAVLEPCRDGTDVIWVQEEPENMGAWYFLRVTVSMQLMGRLPLTGICRAASASPATGSAAAHHIEQEELLERAFRPSQPAPRPRTETITSVKQLSPQ